MKKKSYYGLIGNGETAALIGPDLAVAWLCVPRFDRSPIVASALDPARGGSIWLRLNGAQLPPELQEYEDGTAILQSVATGDGWRLEVLDTMPWGQPCLVRDIRLVRSGSDPAPAQLEWGIDPIRSEAFPVEVSWDDGLIIASAGERAVTVLGAVTEQKVTWMSAGRSATDLGVLSPGEERTVRVIVAYGETEASARAAFAAASRIRLDDVSAFWHDWLSAAKAPKVRPEWAAHYRRSLVTLKLLTYSATGAILAAPTASFPAVPGGGDNWDYRYVWLRDGYYTALTFDAAGMHGEAKRFYDFAFSLQDADGHWRQPLYTVDGADPVEYVAFDLQGPGGETPIRFGNAASGQLQLDNEGNILHGLWFHFRSTGDRSMLQRHWEGVRRACEWTAAHWNQPESGIWELREYVAHWVHGKAMCYAAMRSGALIAVALGYQDEAIQWQRVAEEIRRDVVERGWNAERQAYLAHYGADTVPHVDISVLALAFYGLLPVDDSRLKATVQLLMRPSERGGLSMYGGISRYDYAAVPFYLPTIWLARFCLMAGQVEECDRMLQTCLDCATELGLMAEHFDGRDHTQWGNFPQAFSHEEVVRLILERSQGAALTVW